jgi:hypothetical protein
MVRGFEAHDLDLGREDFDSSIGEVPLEAVKDTFQSVPVVGEVGCVIGGPMPG